jgi:hypothetical protein
MRRELPHSDKRLAQALNSLAEAIDLLQWRYDRDADESVARLEDLRDELQLALVLAECSAHPLH